MEGAIETESLADELSQHMEFLRRMARALVRDEGVAKDVLQETMLAAISRPQKPPDVRAWLRSVLRRRVLMHFRSERRRIARETVLMCDAGADADVVQSDAGLALASIERSSMLGRGVAALEDPYRTVIVLRF